MSDNRVSNPTQTDRKSGDSEEEASVHRDYEALMVELLLNLRIDYYDDQVIY